MLATISEALTEAGLSIESITTELQRHAHTNQTEFVVAADCVTTTYMDKEHIQEMVKNLELLKKSLHLDVVDIRVQRLKANRD